MLPPQTSCFSQLAQNFYENYSFITIYSHQHLAHCKTPKVQLKYIQKKNLHKHQKLLNVEGS